ncbi:MAG: ABC transporter ATP-binding protein [Candidatus Dormibacteria bacterium]
MVHLEDVVKVYGRGDAQVRAVAGVSLEVERGDFIAITGPSGSGKSTLMHIIGCLDVPTGGRYLLGGEDVASMDEFRLATVRNARIGFVFQQFHLLGALTAWRNVELPLLYRRSARDRREVAMEAMQTVGLTSRAGHRPNQMSGGQQQRVAIARALVTDPDIILADEPTGNLDTHSSFEIMELLQNLNSGGRTVVLITHEPEVARMARRRVQIRDGLLSEAVE